jgi:hypothetical protein
MVVSENKNIEHHIDSDDDIHPSDEISTIALSQKIDHEETDVCIGSVVLPISKLLSSPYRIKGWNSIVINSDMFCLGDNSIHSTSSSFSHSTPFIYLEIYNKSNPSAKPFIVDRNNRNSSIAFANATPIHEMNSSDYPTKGSNESPCPPSPRSLRISCEFSHSHKINSPSASDLSAHEDDLKYHSDPDSPSSTESIDSLSSPNSPSSQSHSSSSESSIKSPSPIPSLPNSTLPHSFPPNEQHITIPMTTTLQNQSNTDLVQELTATPSEQSTSQNASSFEDIALPHISFPTLNAENFQKAPKELLSFDSRTISPPHSPSESSLPSIPSLPSSPTSSDYEYQSSSDDSPLSPHSSSQLLSQKLPSSESATYTSPHIHTDWLSPPPSHITTATPAIIESKPINTSWDSLPPRKVFPSASSTLNSARTAVLEARRLLNSVNPIYK